MHDTNIIFYDNDIIILCKNFTEESCIVTFTSRAVDNEKPPSPFGQKILHDQNCSYICVVSLKNHWWQVRNFDQAMKAVKTYIDRIGYRRTTVYGVSMGGVGAVLSSRILKPDEGIIFSAQYDIGPDVVPWDNRWHDDARKLNISFEKNILQSSVDTEFIYIYDMFNLDRRHYLLFSEFLNVKPLALPCSGHEVFTTMKEAGIAGTVARHLLLTTDALESRAAWVRNLYRNSRRKSAIYWRNLANLAARRNKIALLDHALEEIARLGWSDVVSLHTLGLLHLTKKSDPVRAESFYDRCIEIKPDHPAAWRGKSKCRQARNDLDASVELAIAALARNPGSADLGRVLIEAAHRSRNRLTLADAAHHYRVMHPQAQKEDFIVCHVPDDIWEGYDEIQRQAFAATLKAIRERRPRRYSQLYQSLRAANPSSIVEVGIFDGEQARQMIKSVAPASARTRPLTYYGFDLFEDMDARIFEKEFSKYPLSEREIREKLAPLDADIRLYRGDTKVTLPVFVAALSAEGKSVDFAFIDGGHSEETIASDWANIATVLDRHSIVIFDDYYHQIPSDLKDVGCNQIIDQLVDDPAYDVEILPIRDQFQKDNGMLEIALAKVRLAR